uniref:BHLH domain-containing protein n=1 Tax=Branchiostoma floridae TaxID=7739 RepID=C3Z613_BRAFL|eukprot:XP_002596264.1 hypothetical protein BRAFLDRAFT_65983 [Branchiostoma floridae]
MSSGRRQRQACGKLEKAEILEMTVEYIRYLQEERRHARHLFGAQYWTTSYAFYRMGYGDCMRDVHNYFGSIGTGGVSTPDVSGHNHLMNYLQHKATLSGASPIGISQSDRRGYVHGDARLRQSYANSSCLSRPEGLRSQGTSPTSCSHIHLEHAQNITDVPKTTQYLQTPRSSNSPDLDGLETSYYSEFESQREHTMK